MLTRVQLSIATKYKKGMDKKDGITLVVNFSSSP